MLEERQQCRTVGAEQGVHDVCHLAKILLVRLVLLLKLLLHLLVVIFVLPSGPPLAGPREAQVELVLNNAQQLCVLLWGEAVDTKKFYTLNT